MRHVTILQHVCGVFRECRDMYIFKKVFATSVVMSTNRTWLGTTVIDTKETNEHLLQIEDVVHVLIKYMKQRRSATIQVKITESYQLCKATQHWLLEVVQFAVETAPLLLLLAGIFVQRTRVFVKRKTRVTETLLDRTMEIRRIIAHLI